jgi:hypothetical protein
MRSLLPWLRSKPALWRNGLMLLVMTAATVGAFYWGRLGGTTAEAQQVQPRLGAAGQNMQPQTQSDYSRRVVAYIYDMPITREELGEYLIARFGAQRIEFLVNRRIVEMECQAKGIFVSDAEVENQFKEELRSLGNLSVQDFTSHILHRFNKTLYEWKEDAIRPKLMLAKLCRPMVEVTNQDLRNAYESRYGPKVQCRWIVFAKEDKHFREKWAKISLSEPEFAACASTQFIEELRVKGGVLPPVTKHFGDPTIEKAAFNLSPGQVSACLEMKDGTNVVLKCEKHLAAVEDKSFESVRLDLDKELKEIKLDQKIKEYVGVLRKQANPRVLITNQVRQADLVRDVERSLGVPSSGQRPTGPAGN